MQARGPACFLCALSEPVDVEKAAPNRAASVEAASDGPREVESERSTSTNDAEMYFFRESRRLGRSNAERYGKEFETGVWRKI